MTEQPTLDMLYLELANVVSPETKSSRELVLEKRAHDLLDCLKRIVGIEHGLPREEHEAGRYYQMRLSIAQEIAEAGIQGGDGLCVHISRRVPCDHEWDNEGVNPEYCIKCGMSLMAHAMMECP